MATPHWAMAQEGSCLEISVNAALACSYWKECRSATARLKLIATVFEQEVANWTEPTSSAESSWWCSWAARGREVEPSKMARRIGMLRMRFTPSRTQKCKSEGEENLKRADEKYVRGGWTSQSRKASRR